MLARPKLSVIPAVIALGVGIVLVACAPAGPAAPQRIPTAIATNLGSLGPLPAATAPPDPLTSGDPPTSTPPATLPPAIVLPDATGASRACETNTLRLQLTHDDGRLVVAASRIEAYDDHLYLLADGGLYRLDRLAADGGASQLETLLSADDRVGGRPIQELADLALDRERGILFMLDKAGHIFRYEIATGDSAVVYRSHSDEDELLDKQLGALGVDERGRPVVLETAQGALWRPGTSLITLDVVNESRGLTSGADMAYLPGTYYILLHDGSIRTVTQDIGSTLWRDNGNPMLGLSIKATDHLGLDLLVMVDGLRRKVVLMLPDSGDEVSSIIFTYGGMGLLRDVVFDGERMYAASDGYLYIYPGPDTGADGDCPAPPPPGFEAPPLAYGVDVLRAFDGAQIPLSGDWTLPPWPRVYPGASRLYRAGVHEGIDFFSFSGPRNFEAGWPVQATLGGTVTRSTVVYQELDRETYDGMVDASAQAGETPRDLLEKFSGRQVIIEHAGGVRTVYSHLESIEPGIVTGARVEAGQLIGGVGVTGTEGEVQRGAAAPHLHFEIWVGDHYLGYGAPIREAMWWYEQIYALVVEEPD